MATLVFLHAHPDDESILTGGSIARAADEGHRVVLIVATDGRHGEVPDDLGEGESLVDRRRVEAQRSAEVLGIARVEWLGYHDSGMPDTETNQRPDNFWNADLDEATGRLVRIIRAERPQVLMGYGDDWSRYPHPDHIRTHDVSVRAFEAVGCEGLARVDFFVLPGERLVVNEINTMPGFTPTSMYPRMWAASGVDYPALVDRLIQLALRRRTGLR